MNWSWPVRNVNSWWKTRPTGQGTFGAIRRYDVHTGVDIYCDRGDYVCPVEAGIIRSIGLFTGPRAGSPWWNETNAIIVEGKSGLILYGELSECNYFDIGDFVDPSDVIGNIGTVLKKDKGLPMNMLHLEWYERGTILDVQNAFIWKLGEERPKGLLDPTSSLMFADRR